MDSAIMPADKSQGYKPLDWRRFEEDPIPKEILAAFDSDYNVIPLSGQKIYNYRHAQKYRFVNNRRLETKWKELVTAVSEKKRQHSPFIFPRIQDYHFYNCKSQYAPSLTIDNFPHYRHTLRPGPGIDSLGQVPIPNDMQMRRGDPNAQKPPTGRATLKTKKR